MKPMDRAEQAVWEHAYAACSGQLFRKRADGSFAPVPPERLHLCCRGHRRTQAMVRRALMGV